MQTQDVREFVAFCEYLADAECPHTHLMPLLRQLVSSIAAAGSQDGHGEHARDFHGLQRSARRFVSAYHRSHEASKGTPECIHTLMNATSNPQLVKEFLEEIRQEIQSLPRSVRVPTLPPLPAEGESDDDENP
jgi:hypothetical protein